MQATAAFVSLCIGAYACAAAQCRPPSYRTGFVWENSPSTIMMNISIGISDFAPKRLICLASALRQRYSDRREVSILIFSSYAAAENFTHPFGGDSFKPRTNWSLDDHGTYFFNAETGQEYIEIMPLGQNRSFMTRINLPVTTPPPCTLEMAGRCLLALNDVGYPWDALKTKSSGTITLEGSIDPSGILEHVGVVAIDVHPAESQRLLVDAAIQNLKTWRLESAGRRDRVRIVYSYTIDSSGRPGETRVNFDLPHKVEIRARPPH